MVVIQNLKRLQTKLQKLAEKYRSEGSLVVVVGYAARYAVYVHEVQARHAPGKQWKFLEQPARELQPQLGQMLAESISKGVRPLQSLYLVGMRLQAASQDIVPVDTGNLKGSAFTAKEDDLPAVIAASEGKLLERMQKQGEAKAKKSVMRKATRMRRSRAKSIKGLKTHMAKTHKIAKVRAAKQAKVKKAEAKKSMRLEKAVSKYMRKAGIPYK